MEARSRQPAVRGGGAGGDGRRRGPLERRGAAAERRKPVWRQPIDVPMPAGRGFRNGHLYHLPLSTGELATIDLRRGRMITRSRFPSNVKPGNLVAADGTVVMQSSSAAPGLPPDGRIREGARRHLGAQAGRSRRAGRARRIASRPGTDGSRARRPVSFAAPAAGTTYRRSGRCDSAGKPSLRLRQQPSGRRAHRAFDRRSGTTVRVSSVDGPGTRAVGRLCRRLGSRLAPGRR